MTEATAKTLGLRKTEEYLCSPTRYGVAALSVTLVAGALLFVGGIAWQAINNQLPPSLKALHCFSDLTKGGAIAFLVVGSLTATAGIAGCLFFIKLHLGLRRAIALRDATEASIDKQAPENPISKKEDKKAACALFCALASNEKITKEMWEEGCRFADAKYGREGIGSPNDSGDTPLHIAVRNPAFRPFLQDLLDLAPEALRVRDAQGMTPRFDGDRELSSILVDWFKERIFREKIKVNDLATLRKTGVNELPSFESPFDKVLLEAAQHGTKECVLLFLEQGGKNVRSVIEDDDQFNLLHCAVLNEEHHMAVLTVLSQTLPQDILSKMAKSIETRNQQTPYALAVKKHRSEEALELLKSLSLN